MTKAKNKSRTNGKKYLQESFTLEQELLKVKLRFSQQSITHSSTLGEVNENYIIEALRKYLPRRYAVESGIAIDSNGKTSDQIDVIIYDDLYTPTLLDQENHHFITAEAIYAIFEVKPLIDKPNIEYADKKAKSVRNLKRTSVEIHHAGGVFPAKTPFRILAGIIATEISWKERFESKHFQSLISSENIELDCGLAVSGGCFDTYEGKIIIGPEKQALNFFLFRLLNKLQSLGTVPAIDWNQYASVFAK